MFKEVSEKGTVKSAVVCGSPSDEFLSEYREIFKLYLGEFGHYLRITTQHRFDSSDILYDVNVFEDIGRRLYQRTEYYRYFHSELEVSQIKKVGILTYWLLKYKPFRWVSPLAIPIGEGKYDVNVYFAFFYFKSSIYEYCRRIGQAEDVDGVQRVKPVFDNTYGLKYNFDFFEGKLEELYLHSFSECDLSKEAFVLLAETCVQKFQ
ncbi:hypothetical protein FACS1894133_0850 [Clostridia bacterium]|nr:hypothetical protein FACS1894133_0850 [Clostridia bacterium]